MKKIIPIFFVLLSFFGCSAKNYTPVLNTEFTLYAVYKTGDFSYTCKIEKAKDYVSVIPTSSSAEGMIISCNGKEVTFKRGEMVKRFDKNEIDKTNPAVVLYEIFSSLENAQVKLVDGVFTYSAKTSIGNYTLTQDKDNSFTSINIPEAEIVIEFQD